MYSRLWIVLCAVCGVGLLNAQYAPGNTIFTQPPLNNGVALPSDTEFFQEEVDNFTLGAAANAVSIRWWGAYGFGFPVPAASDFLLRFYTDVAGTPALVNFNEQTLSGVTPIATALTDANSNTTGAVYEFAANIPIPVALAGGTPYWLSLIENTANSRWSWTPDGGGSHFYRTVDGGAWNLSGFLQNHAFELYDAPLSPQVVPLPAAAWAGMALIGGLGVGTLRRRKDQMAHV